MPKVPLTPNQLNILGKHVFVGMKLITVVWFVGEFKICKALASTVNAFNKLLYLRVRIARHH
jgi:hypothetical protein